jgi:hypothetical protein
VRERVLEFADDLKLALAIGLGWAEHWTVWEGLLLARGIGMRRLAGLFRRIFGTRARPVEDDAALPFTPEELARLIRSGRHEDMQALADGLACQSIPRRSAHRAPH